MGPIPGQPESSTPSTPEHSNVDQPTIAQPQAGASWDSQERSGVVAGAQQQTQSEYAAELRGNQASKLSEDSINNLSTSHAHREAYEAGALYDLKKVAELRGVPLEELVASLPESRVNTTKSLPNGAVIEVGRDILRLTKESGKDLEPGQQLWEEGARILEFGLQHENDGWELWEDRGIRVETQERQNGDKRMVVTFKGGRDEIIIENHYSGLPDVKLEYRSPMSPESYNGSYHVEEWQLSPHEGHGAQYEAKTQTREEFDTVNQWEFLHETWGIWEPGGNLTDEQLDSSSARLKIIADYLGGEVDAQGFPIQVRELPELMYSEEYKLELAARKAKAEEWRAKKAERDTKDEQLGISGLGVHGILNKKFAEGVDKEGVVTKGGAPDSEGMVLRDEEGRKFYWVSRMKPGEGGSEPREPYHAWQIEDNNPTRKLDLSIYTWSIACLGTADRPNLMPKVYDKQEEIDDFRDSFGRAQPVPVSDWPLETIGLKKAS